MPNAYRYKERKVGLVVVVQPHTIAYKIFDINIGHKFVLQFLSLMGFFFRNIN
jgi:hypothetical protein